MRAVVQRVSSAAVSVDGQDVGAIGNGLVVFLGVQTGDTDRDVALLSGKIAGLRVFEDEHGAMNLSVHDVGGAALVISQFTLLGDARRGKRPSFTDAMAPAEAIGLYEAFIAALSSEGVPVQSGRFQALMDVRSVNHGPVTLLLDSRKLF